MCHNRSHRWPPTPTPRPGARANSGRGGSAQPTSSAPRPLDPTSRDFIPLGGISVRPQSFATTSSQTQTRLAFTFESQAALQTTIPGSDPSAARPAESRVIPPGSLACRLKALGRRPLRREPNGPTLRLPFAGLEQPSPTPPSRVRSVALREQDYALTGLNTHRSQPNPNVMHNAAGRGMPARVQSSSNMYAHTHALPRNNFRMNDSAHLRLQPEDRVVATNQHGIDGHARGLSPSKVGSRLSTLDDEVAAARQLSGPPSPGSEPYRLSTRFSSEPCARPLSPSTTTTTSSIHLPRHQPSTRSLVELSRSSRLGIDKSQKQEDDEQTPTASRYKMSERPPPPSQQGPPPRMMSLTSPTRTSTDRGMPSTPTHNPLINRGMGQSTRGMASSNHGLSTDATSNNAGGSSSGELANNNFAHGNNCDTSFGGLANNNNSAHDNNGGTSYVVPAHTSNNYVYGRGNYDSSANNAGYRNNGGTSSGGPSNNTYAYGHGNASANNKTYDSGNYGGASSGGSAPNGFARSGIMGNINTRSFAGGNQPLSMAASRPSDSGGRMDQYNNNETALQAISDNTSLDISEFSMLNIENTRPNVDPFGPTPSAATSSQSGALLTPADGMSRELRALTQGGRAKPNAAVALNVTYLPFKEFCLTARQFTYGVIVITNIPYNLTRSEVQAFLGRNAKIVPEVENESIHIIMERVTSKTLDCYVEFTSVSEAIAAVNRFEALKMSGRSGRLGQRHVEVELSSQEDLMKQLFPKARNVQWSGSRPNIIPRDPADKYNSGFQGFISSEELVMLVKHVESPQRSPFSKECPQRPFECLISTLSKYPWYMTKYINIQDRNRLFRATVTLLNILMDRVSREYDPVHLNGMLVKRVTLAAIACPGFSPNMKDDIVYHSGMDGRKAHELGMAPHACGWRPLWTIGPKKDAPYDLVMYYIKLISEWTMKNCRKPTLAEQAAEGQSEYGPSSMFGRLEEFLSSNDPQFGLFTLAEVAEKEWAVLEKIIRESLPAAPESQ